jgi:fatty acid/phospholipid biosynthesis enzyme
VGLNGTVVKVHGSASARVVGNAIIQMADVASEHLYERIREEIARANEAIAVPA